MPSRNRQVFVIVPAAGSSSRMRSAPGRPASKALIPVGGRPVLVRTLEAVSTAARVVGGVVLAPESLRSQFEDVIQGAELPKPFPAVAGGASRQESVLLGLEWLIRERGLLAADPEPLILVHDAARCFVSTDLVNRVIEAADRLGAVSAALPCTDTIKEIDQAGAFVSTPPRDVLRRIQTPQVFGARILWAAHRKAVEDGIENATDDGALVERLHPVYEVPGDEQNLKLTTEADLTFADFLASSLSQK